MRLVYSLKLLSDLLLYMSFAGLASALAGSGGLFMYLMFFIPCAVIIGLLANNGKLRFFALMLLIPAFLYALQYSVLQLILLAPVFVYFTYYAAKLPYDIKIIWFAMTGQFFPIPDLRL